MELATEGLVHNPTFDNLDKAENTELRFFCEAFSLVDTMKNTSMLLAFSNLVKKSKEGRIKWTEIPDLYPDDYDGQCSYFTTLERLYDAIDEVIRIGWVTPMRTKTLSALAMEIHEFKREEVVKKMKGKKTLSGDAFRPSQAWLEFAHRLTKLYEFQESHMKIHVDFQRSNYLPHPDSWKVYLGTVSVILAAVVFGIVG